MVFNKSLKYSKLLPSDGIQSFILAGTSNTIKDVNFPIRSRNWGECVLDQTVRLCDPGATTKFNILHTIGLPFLENLQLRTLGNVMPIDMTNANVYYRCSAPFTTRLSDSSAQSNLGAITQATRTTVIQRMCFKSNTLATAVAVASANNAQRLNSASSSPAAGVAPASVSYSECQYYAVGADTSISEMHYQLKLKELTGTILPLPGNLAYPEIMNLRITYAPLNKLGLYTTDAADLNTAAALVNTGSTTAGPAIIGLQIWDAVETDVEQSNKDWDAVNRGISIPFPFVYTFRIPYTSASTFFYQQKLTSYHGQRLLRCKYVNAHATETEQTFGEIQNTQEADGDCNIVLNRYTSMNGVRIQDTTVASGEEKEDWLEHRDMCEGGYVQDVNQYNHSSVWVDDFTGLPLVDTPVGDFIAGIGYPLENVEQTYSINQVNNGSLSKVVYLFVECQKTLIINGPVIQVV